jgi:cell division protein FtsN
VSNFFGNMFGSGSEAAPAAPIATGSTGQGPNWGSETTVVTAQTSSMVQRSPDSPPAATHSPATHSPATPPDQLPWGTANASSGASQTASVEAAAPVKTAAVGAAGKYRLQVAAVRSREEAERLAQTLHGYQPVRDGMVSPEIDEAVIGSMGTFYRVRLGPYADAKEPGQLCKTLKPQGFDCLVVTQ